MTNYEFFGLHLKDSWQFTPKPEYVLTIKVGKSERLVDIDLTDEQVIRLALAAGRATAEIARRQP